MCGFIFVEQTNARPVSAEAFSLALAQQSWRGPDATQVVGLDDGAVLLGHNRLAILDPIARSDQPMRSACGRYLIVFNGEIYNHKALRSTLPVDWRTQSDTETVLEGFVRRGSAFVAELDGMFAFVIYDTQSRRWFAARDAFGIKPLYVFQGRDAVAFGSEPAALAHLFSLPPDPVAIAEWRVLRRPAPGMSFFQQLHELPPGSWMASGDSAPTRFFTLSADQSAFSQERFAQLLSESVKAHELSDVQNVALLSGGLDSGVITALSSVQRAYCIGLEGNHEIDGAQQSASALGRTLVSHMVSESEMEAVWRKLTKLRGEPLSVPNEALIYLICRQMAPQEKVLLTGEGADELLFGYDNIYRWAVVGDWLGPEDFLRRYGYSLELSGCDRVVEWVEQERAGKQLIEFVDDFFYKFHLPGLLRRMDFASMAASKEARVPFVSKQLINYMYRKPAAVKIDPQQSKIPLRQVAGELGLSGALGRKKIGFSATPRAAASRFDEYARFQTIVLESLGW